MANDLSHRSGHGAGLPDFGADFRTAEDEAAPLRGQAEDHDDMDMDGEADDDAPADRPMDHDLLADMDDDLDDEDTAPRATNRAPRRPRIALMGEFSAGKSTLSNLLIGSTPLPVKVTATKLPPVWISWGDGPAYREDLDGTTHPVDIDRIAEIDPAATRVIRLFCQSEILEMCDIIDMPGISDPNMPSEVWERVIGEADGVLWCTHATQAWRQSEAAVWESLDEALHAKSLLVVTRYDKLLTDQDRRRVMKRVARETEGLFADRLPISLTGAMAAGDDRALWTESGAAAFIDRFVALLAEIAEDTGAAPPRPARGGAAARPTSMLRFLEPEPEAEAPGDLPTARIVPMRVRPVSVSRRPNATPRPEGGATVIERF